MANDFYTFTTPVVPGTTIRADKYNSDQQALESGFGLVEEKFLSSIQLPSTFTGNNVVPEQSTENTFIYINPTGDIALYPIQTFLDQFALVEQQYNLTVIARGDAEGFAQDASQQAGLALNHANLASTHKDDAQTYANTAQSWSTTASGFSDDAQAWSVVSSGFADNASDFADLANEYANKPENTYVTGTLNYSAYHWAQKAQASADDAEAIVAGNFVPLTRTINGKALDSNIILSPADISSVPTTRTINNKALSANISLTSADTGSVPTTRTINTKPLSANVTLSASDIGSTDGNVQTDINALQAFEASTGTAATYDVGAGNGLNADLLDNQHGAYYLDWANFTGKPTTTTGYGITNAVTVGDTVAITGDATGSSTFDANGNVSVNVSVVNNSHTHTASNITDAGTAVTYDVTTSATDTTAGRLTKVGDFGLGAPSSEVITAIGNFDTNKISGLYRTASGETGTPFNSSIASVINLRRASTNSVNQIYLRGDDVFNTGQMYFRGGTGTDFSDWFELYHSGNSKNVGVERSGTLNRTLTRLGGVSKHFQLSTATGTLTLNTSLYEDNDVVEIYKLYQNGTLAITTSSGAIYIPDQTFAATHTIASGYAVCVKLVYANGNWTLSIS